MEYRIKKETKPTLPTFGKYKAVAVHPTKIISSDEIIEAVIKDRPYSGGEVIGIVTRLSEVINNYLRLGYKVRLDEWGLLKLEIESEKVDSPEDFNPKKHIRGTRLHFIPQSRQGTQALYAGITFEKDK